MRQAAGIHGAEIARHATWPWGMLLLLLLLPSISHADWQEFIPRPFENGAFLDGYASFERDHSQSHGNHTRWEDLFFREKLTLFSQGYSYHPRFLQYRFSIAGAQGQESYTSTSLGSRGWHNQSGLEYDATLFVLPEHVYNMEVYARRYEPLFKEQAATQHGNVDNRRGFDFRYRDKPYFAHVGFLDNSVESGGRTSNIDRLNANGEYFNRLDSGNEFSFTGGANPAWFNNSLGLDGSSVEYLAGNYFNLSNIPWWAPPVRLTSTVTQSEYEQHGTSAGDLKSDQFVWYEWLTVTLPWNARSDAYYRHQDNDRTSDGRKQTYGSEDLKVDLIHRLYESLDSIFTFQNNQRTSSGGKSDSTTEALTFSYTKRIPDGRILVGANGSTNTTDNRGQVDVVNESFSSSVPMLQPYVLGQQNVDPNSIIVYVKSPLEPFELVLLEPSQYTIEPLQNTYGVRVNSLPPDFAVTGTFEFLVSYSYSGEFSLRTNTLGTNASVELLNGLVTPYGAFSAVRSDVLSGTFPGVPVDANTYTAGTLLRYAGFQLRGEYQYLQWDVSPYELWKAELQYVQSLTDTTSVYGAAAYTNRHYPRGPSIYERTAFTEETETVTGSIQQELFSRDLRISVGGSYSAIQGLVDSEGYSINSTLLWHVGKVDLTVGARAYDTTSTSGPTTSTERDHQFVYLNLRRRLF